jgi:hypothetical protein
MSKFLVPKTEIQTETKNAKNNKLAISFVHVIVYPEYKAK